MTSLRPLLMKELVDLTRNRIAFVPVLIAAGVAIVMPFLVVVVMPIASGHALGTDADLLKVSIVTGIHDELAPEARVQFFLFQQFLMLFLLLPITGAMSLASHAVVGEKQARTLEPLLATPVTTLELLVAKVLGALAPTLAIAVAGLVLYFIGIAVVAGPGVLEAMSTARTFVLVFLVGPASALVALQAAVLISSRVNDARTAQQFGVLIILPMTALLVAQFTGSIWLSAWMLGLIGAGLLIAWVLLVLFSVAMFEREAILTRWK
jgi:ABC-2 type transport system permease protein